MKNKMCDSNAVAERFESQGSLGTKRLPPSSCRICLSSIFDPAALSCGHKFCEKCLSQYWQVKEKPDYIVCPLCRACAFNINFAKKEELSSTEDFRKTFNALQKANEREIATATIFCLKLSIVMPALYFMLKWLKSPAVELFTLMLCKLGQIM